MSPLARNLTLDGDPASFDSDDVSCKIETTWLVPLTKVSEIVSGTSLPISTVTLYPTSVWATQLPKRAQRKENPLTSLASTSLRAAPGVLPKKTQTLPSHAPIPRDHLPHALDVVRTSPLLWCHRTNARVTFNPTLSWCAHVDLVCARGDRLSTKPAPGIVAKNRLSVFPTLQQLNLSLRRHLGDYSRCTFFFWTESWKGTIIHTRTNKRDYKPMCRQSPITSEVDRVTPSAPWLPPALEQRQCESFGSTACKEGRPTVRPCLLGATSQD